MTTERRIPWATIWVAIRTVSHLEESGTPQEATTAMEAVTGVSTSPSVQMVRLGWEQSTMVKSMYKIRSVISTASVQEEQSLQPLILGVIPVKSALGPMKTQPISSQMAYVAIMSTDHRFIAGRPWLTSLVILSIYLTLFNST